MTQAIPCAKRTFTTKSDTPKSAASGRHVAYRGPVSFDELGTAEAVPAKLRLNRTGALM